MNAALFDCGGPGVCGIARTWEARIDERARWETDSVDALPEPKQLNPAPAALSVHDDFEYTVSYIARERRTEPRRNLFSSKLVSGRIAVGPCRPGPLAKPGSGLLTFKVGQQ
jgi:hypothetical protein